MKNKKNVLDCFIVLFLNLQFTIAVNSHDHINLSHNLSAFVHGHIPFKDTQTIFDSFDILLGSNRVIAAVYY